MTCPSQIHEEARLAKNVPLSAQLRLLSLIEVLAGNEIIGLPLKEVTDLMASGVAQSTVWRDLKTLESAGWAQQSRDGRWTLGSRPYQLLHHFYSGLKAVQERTAEVAVNYTRIPT
ncbi:MAG: hypothetical protein FWH15_06370 [Betaproteobacteria bacterium]|nr:hypothetical protein [Betaproteobacteria bacterium]